MFSVDGLSERLLFDEFVDVIGQNDSSKLRSFFDSHPTYLLDLTEKERQLLRKNKAILQQLSTYFQEGYQIEESPSGRRSSLFQDLSPTFSLKPSPATYEEFVTQHIAFHLILHEGTASLKELGVLPKQFPFFLGVLHSSPTLSASLSSRLCDRELYWILLLQDFTTVEQAVHMRLVSFSDFPPLFFEYVESTLLANDEKFPTLLQQLFPDEAALKNIEAILSFLLSKSLDLPPDKDFRNPDSVQNAPLRKHFFLIELLFHHTLPLFRRSNKIRDIGKLFLRHPLYLIHLSEQTLKDLQSCFENEPLEDSKRQSFPPLLLEYLENKSLVKIDSDLKERLLLGNPTPAEEILEFLLNQAPPSTEPDCLLFFNKQVQSISLLTQLLLEKNLVQDKTLLSFFQREACRPYFFGLPDELQQQLISICDSLPSRAPLKEGLRTIDFASSSGTRETIGSNLSWMEILKRDFLSHQSFWAFELASSLYDLKLLSEEDLERVSLHLIHSLLNAVKPLELPPRLMKSKKKGIAANFLFLILETYHYYSTFHLLIRDREKKQLLVEQQRLLSEGWEEFFDSFSEDPSLIDFLVQAGKQRIQLSSHSFLLLPPFIWVQLLKFPSLSEKLSSLMRDYFLNVDVQFITEWFNSQQYLKSYYDTLNRKAPLVEFAMLRKFTQCEIHSHSTLLRNYLELHKTSFKQDNLPNITRIINQFVVQLQQTPQLCSAFQVGLFSQLEEHSFFISKQFSKESSLWHDDKLFSHFLRILISLKLDFLLSLFSSEEESRIHQQSHLLTFFIHRPLFSLQFLQSQYKDSFLQLVAFLKQEDPSSFLSTLAFGEFLLDLFSVISIGDHCLLPSHRTLKESTECDQNLVKFLTESQAIIRPHSFQLILFRFYIMQKSMKTDSDINRMITALSGLKIESFSSKEMAFLIETLRQDSLLQEPILGQMSRFSAQAEQWVMALFAHPQVQSALLRSINVGYGRPLVKLDIPCPWKWHMEVSLVKALKNLHSDRQYHLTTAALLAFLGIIEHPDIKVQSSERAIYSFESLSRFINFAKEKGFWFSQTTLFPPLHFLVTKQSSLLDKWIQQELHYEEYGYLFIRLLLSTPGWMEDPHELPPLLHHLLHQDTNYLYKVFHAHPLLFSLFKRKLLDDARLTLSRFSKDPSTASFLRFVFAGEFKDFIRELFVQLKKLGVFWNEEMEIVSLLPFIEKEAMDSLAFQIQMREMLGV